MSLLLALNVAVLPYMVFALTVGCVGIVADVCDEGVGCYADDARYYSGSG